MSQAKHLEVLLQAIRDGKHDGKPIPEVASQSIDFAILSLAASGELAPQELLKVYPDIKRLRKHIVGTMQDQVMLGNQEFADQLNDFFIMKLCFVAGGDA